MSLEEGLLTTNDDRPTTNSCLYAACTIKSSARAM